MASIRQLPQCLPQPLVEAVTNHVTTARWNHGWRSNTNMGYAHWNQDYVGCGTENGLEAAALLPEPLSTAWTHLRTTYFPGARLLRCYANAHTFGVEGYPHTDSRRLNDSTLVIYLNRDWRREWGGETMIYDGKTILHAELPEFNTGLVFPGNRFHTARAVSRICPELRVTLMFKMAHTNDPDRDRLQVFLQSTSAKTTRHTRGTLMGHLLRVYDLLKSWGYDNDVCLAGGIHSIFGTNIFTEQTVTDRVPVTVAVGESATQLAELFGKINRPTTLETALSQGITQLELTAGGRVSVTQEQLNSLCALEAANLWDQNALKSHNNIRKFVKTEE